MQFNSQVERWGPNEGKFFAYRYDGIKKTEYLYTDGVWREGDSSGHEGTTAYFESDSVLQDLLKEHPPF